MKTCRLTSFMTDFYHIHLMNSMIAVLLGHTQPHDTLCGKVLIIDICSILTCVVSQRMIDAFSCPCCAIDADIEMNV